MTHLIYGSGHVYGIAINHQEIVGFERDDLHREVKRYYGNNLILDSQFDVMGRLVRQNLAFEQQQALQIDNYHLYQAKYFEDVMGLHYNHFRYYEPEQYIVQEHDISAAIRLG